MTNPLQLIVSDRKLAESTATGYSRRDIIQYNVYVDTLTLTFDAEWNGLNKCLTFETDDNIIENVPYIDGMYIPWENLTDYGRLYITVSGFDNGVMVLNTRRMEKPLIIEESAPNGSKKPQEPTRSILIRALAAANAIEGMTVSAVSLPSGAAPTVTISKTNPNGYHLTFGIPGGGGGGTMDHFILNNRNHIESHPMSAITGLVDALGEKVEEAPINGKKFARKNAGWTEIVNATSSDIDEIFA